MSIPFGGQSQQRWGDNTFNPNETMRDIQLTDLSGKPCNTSDARKKGMLVLTFVRMDDPACAQTLAALQRLADGTKESGKVTVWAVSQSGATETRDFVKAHGVTFPVLLDRDGYYTLLCGVTAVPTVYLADGRGIIQRKMVGYKPAVLNALAAQVSTFIEATEPLILVEGVVGTTSHQTPAIAPVSPIALPALPAPGLGQPFKM